MFLTSLHYFFLQDHCVLNFITLEKQGRPNRVRGYLRVQRFLQDTSLSPVAALVTYQAQVCLMLWGFLTDFILFRCQD